MGAGRFPLFDWLSERKVSACSALAALQACLTLAQQREMASQFQEMRKHDPGQEGSSVRHLVANGVPIDSAIPASYKSSWVPEMLASG